MMPLNYRILALCTSAICFALAATWLLVPGLLLSLWNVQTSPAAELVARRGAVLFFGFAIMFFSSRNTEPSVTRLSLVRGFAVGCLALACLGIFEFVLGHAGVGIFLAVVVELLLAVLFFVLAHRDVNFLHGRA
jgi:hypothetical protein